MSSATLGPNSIVGVVGTAHQSMILYAMVASRQHKKNMLIVNRIDRQTDRHTDMADSEPERARRVQQLLSQRQLHDEGVLASLVTSLFCLNSTEPKWTTKFNQDAMR